MTAAVIGSLLSPSVTRRVIDRMAQQPLPELAAHAKLDELTSREREVLELIARGLSNREIATELVVEESTVRTHVKRIQMKLQLRDRVQIVIFAYETGVNQPAPQPADAGLRESARDVRFLAVISLQTMRKRLPLWAFIVLAILCLVLLGIACACATNHPTQQIDRAFGAVSAIPALVEVWTFTFAALSLLIAVDVRRRRSTDATSPAFLQRFLF
jgi:DNA-binding CsgD family transcriptional regulator